ncbi:5-hydroxytryptamine receptor 1, partial [Schistocerca nitens]|uniref:5-hydroxytryptamine receptor 1 n=1 Tax=Schistocerca nitens TaxID=7011 RepID=UPI002119570A
AAASGAGAASSNSSANASSAGSGGGGGGGGGPPPDEWWFPGPRSPYSPAEAVLIALVLLCVIVGTVVGNVLVCVAVCLVRKLRRPCNYLLVSLAVSDLCVALLVMPMALLSEIFGVWSFGPVACDLWVSFDVLSCTASILNLCMISVDRYYAITKPLEYGVRRTPRRMVASVALVWLGAACISLPPLLILGNEHEDPHGLPQCQVCQNFAYQIYATLGSFYIPLSVMIVVYYKIFRAARKIVLEERRAQSHLRAHSYLEISVGNGGGPPETRLAQSSSSPAVRAQHQQQQHRPSTTSTNTTVSTNRWSPDTCPRPVCP